MHYLELQANPQERLIYLETKKRIYHLSHRRDDKILYSTHTKFPFSGPALLSKFLTHSFRSVPASSPSSSTTHSTQAAMVAVNVGSPSAVVLSPTRAIIQATSSSAKYSLCWLIYWMSGVHIAWLGGSPRPLFGFTRLLCTTLVVC